MPARLPRSYDSVDSNWTVMYVMLSLIPVAFAAVAILSVRRDKATQREKHDIEMAIIHRRARFPWREAVGHPERPEEPRGQQPYVRPPPQVVTNPPIPPANFGRPVRARRGEEVDVRIRNRDVT
ncbi:hypothetical protein F4805DRAFT_463221 [Annulohypoxylon moriforme]|nr:hypothetical protein F4805DRAFT_463221 [Annulohypoxylon moriforme]